MVKNIKQLFIINSGEKVLFNEIFTFKAKKFYIANDIEVSVINRDSNARLRSIALYIKNHWINF